MRVSLASGSTLCRRPFTMAAAAAAEDAASLAVLWSTRSGGRAAGSSAGCLCSLQPEDRGSWFAAAATSGVGL